MRRLKAPRPGELLPTDLRYALESLLRSEARVGRNNARARVRSVLKRVEAFMDREYPVIPKAASKRRGPLTRQGWEARMRARRYVRSGFSGGDIPSEWLEAKVPARKSPKGHWWVPWWATVGDLSVTRLSELKRSAKARAALFTQKALVP